MAARVLWRVAVVLGREVLAETMSLLADSLAAGIQAKLEGLLPFDDVQALRERLESCGDDLASCFPELAEPLQAAEALRDEIEGHVHAVSAEFETYLDDIETVATAAEALGWIIKLAVIAIQCSSPPGWGCLKLLASEVTRSLVERVLQICWVQERIRDFGESLFDFQSFPRLLASEIATIVEGALPSTLAPIFDRSVFASATLGNAELPCNDEQLQETVRLLLELQDQYGEEYFDALVELMEAWGVEGSESVEPDTVRRLAAALAETGLTLDQIRLFTETQQPPEDSEREVTVDVFLRQVAEASTAAFQSGAADALAQGLLDEQLASLANGEWRVILQSPVMHLGRQASRPILYKDADGVAAAGTGTIDFEPGTLDCSRSTVRVRLTDVVLRTAAGTTPGWPGTETGSLEAQLTMDDESRNHLCPGG